MERAGTVTTPSPKSLPRETKQAGLAAALLASASVLTGVLNLTFNVLVARSSGSKLYGAYGALATFATIAGVLAVGTNYAVARRVARSSELTPKLIRRCLRSVWPWLVLTLILAACSAPIANYLHISESDVLIAVLLFGLLVGGAAPAGILIGLRKFKTLVALNITAAVARLAVGPLLATGPQAVKGALVASMIPALILGPGALMVVLVGRRRGDDWATPVVGSENEGSLSAEAVGGAVLAALLWGMWSLPLVFGRHFLSPGQAGSFAAAQVLASSLLFLSTPFVSGFFPVVSRGREESTATLGLMGLVGIGAAGVLCLGVLGPTIVGPLYGSGYATDSKTFVGLGISAVLLAAANYSVWMARSLRRGIWLTFVGGCVAFGTEIALGALGRGSETSLAISPAIAVCIGAAVAGALGAVLSAFHSYVGRPAREAAYPAGGPAVATFLDPLDQRPFVDGPGGGPADEGAGDRPNGSPVEARGGTRLREPRVLAGVGVAAVIGIGLFHQSSALSNAFALAAFVVLAVATVGCLVQTRRQPRVWTSAAGSRVAWAWSMGLAGFATALAAQTWFKVGTVIASGDVSPPYGTAWLTNLFKPWTWTGTNLGIPGATSRQLPWAAVLTATEKLGGSAALAQRLWITLIVAATAMATVALLRTLGIGPVGALLGAALYVFNARSLLDVPNDVYLLAMLLIPLLVALVLAAAKGTVRPFVAAIAMAATSPLLGYMSQNPGLLVGVVASVLAAPVCAGWLGGRAALKRGLFVAFGGGALTLIVSAYWIVPTLVQSTSASVSSLSSSGSWAWTEGRSTLANGFWLNTSWGWNFPEYFPFDGTYGHMPLALLEFALPALAFCSLAIRSRDHPSASATLARRIAGGASLTALLFILFSNGTRLPGAVVFDPLYDLPFGWLLREPGRFLTLAALAYAVMVGVVVDHVVARFGWSQSISHLGLKRLRTVPALPVCLCAVAAVALAPAFPMFTGAVVPDARPKLPPSHVSLPTYWDNMTGYVNSSSVKGSLLVLPADDYYQVDYTWGYYGSDSFIEQMVNRHVIAPVPQGYVSTSPQLLSSVDAASNDILASNWQGLQATASVLQTPLILVRGDVDATYLGNNLANPAALAAALASDPQAKLVHKAGPLELFALKVGKPAETEANAKYATVDTSQPNLQVLASLPGVRHLVTSPTQPGTVNVSQVPGLGAWHVENDYLTIRIGEQGGRKYDVIDLNPQYGTNSEVSLTGSGTPINSGAPPAAPSAPANIVAPPVSYAIAPGTIVGTISLPGGKSLDVPYDYGSTELAWLRSNLGKGPITQDMVNQITAAYQEEVGRLGAEAETYHYVVTYGTVAAESANGKTLHLLLPVQEALNDGDFRQGLWSEVGDCNDVHGKGASDLRASVLPDVGPAGAPALALSARYDSACTSRSLYWNGGDIQLSMQVRHVSGADPRVCIYEPQLSRCAPSSPLPTSGTWTTYSATVVPDVAVSSLRLFLYSDGSGQAAPTVNEFADIHASVFQGTPPVMDVVGTPPPGSSSPSLEVLHESFSNKWSGPSSDRHVLVDGLVNGWLGTSTDKPSSTHYGPTSEVKASQLLSLAAVAVCAGALLGVTLRRRLRRRRPAHRPRN